MSHWLDVYNERTGRRLRLHVELDPARPVDANGNPVITRILAMYEWRTASYHMGQMILMKAPSTLAQAA